MKIMSLVNTWKTVNGRTKKYLFIDRPDHKYPEEVLKDMENVNPLYFHLHELESGIPEDKIISRFKQVYYNFKRNGSPLYDTPDLVQKLESKRELPPSLEHLTDDDIVEIRRLYDNKLMKVKELVEKYKLNRSTLSLIYKRKVGNHV